MRTTHFTVGRFFYSNHYDNLQLSAQKKQSGELSILLQVGLPTQLLMYMDIYAYHLQHPELSQWKISLIFDCGKSTIQRALVLMNQPLT